MHKILLIIGFIVLIAPVAGAQEKADSTQERVDTKQEETGPVAVPVMSEKAVRYYRSGTVLWLVNIVLGLLIPALFLFTGFSARIRDWAQSLGRKWFFVIAIYFVVFTIMNFLIYFPLSYYQDFVRQHAYDLSNQTFSKWFSDSLKGLMVGLIMGVLFLWIPYLLLKKSPKRWWLYTSMLAIPFFCLVILISPIWIDPLFNKFGPMKDKALEGKILALADKAGIEGGRVYEVNKSVDTKTVNAYVTGFLDTKRIVLWDTILAKLNKKELLVVMGHEMGHYVLGHVVKAILFFSFITLVLLYAAYRTAGGLIQRFKNRFGFDQLSDIASLPLILLLINIFTLVITPVTFTFTRYQEHEADRFGLEITQTNHAAAMAFVKLQKENLSNPRPGLIMKLWRWTHPPLGERIDFCNQYRPWEKGHPLKYGHLFR
ncbi:M48 family metallopeptidase [bacterium]|nr:M48 family metallopeptidase [bacterium]